MSGLPQQKNHWCRVVMNKVTADRVSVMSPETLDALEVSGSAWESVGFKSYENLTYPNFDICTQTLPRNYDLIIAEQVFEHVADPMSAAKNIRQMLRKNGTFLISTPFLIKYHPAPLDLWRWTAAGMKIFLEQAGFVDVETYSWGNRACVLSNFEQWTKYDPEKHSLENEPEFPLVVWGFARHN
jgi:SAM-dependent methyltransferase